MIDLSSVKAPGWSRVVQELNAPAADDRAYLERLTRLMAQVSVARQAVLMLPDRADGEEIEPRAEYVWTSGPSDPALAPPAAASSARPATLADLDNSAEMTSAARSALASGQTRVFSLGKNDTYYDGGGSGGTTQGCIIAVPLSAAPPAPPVPAAAPGGAPSTPPLAAVVLLLEARSREGVRSTLAMAEVLAGYVAGHGARQALRRSQAAGFSLDLAARLIAGINNAPSFKGACLQLVNDLARQFALDRASLGWVTDDTVRVQAISDVEHFDRRTAMVQRLQTAMDECLDQEQPVVFPAPPADGPGGDSVLAEAIVHAHRELAASSAHARVCSLPLRIDDEVAGVVTVETSGRAAPPGTHPGSPADGGHIDPQTVELVQSALDLAAPVLRIRRADDRWLPQRAWDSVLRAAGWVVGPRHTPWKLAAIAVFALAMFLTFYTTTYRVGAEATIEPRIRRIVSAPWDGVIRALGPGVAPDSRVQPGQLLVELDTAELRLGLANAQAKIEQARTQAAAARKEQDQAKLRQAEAQEKQAAAEAAVYVYRIEKSRIEAPIGGVIIAGDLEDRVGSTIKLGEPLMEIAPLDDLIVVARVDERDIALVREAVETRGGAGAIATKSRPAEPFDFTVERIIPLAAAEEAMNTFEVRARMSGGAPWLRPGMEGVANFDTQRRPLYWILSRRIVDRVRLWLW